MCVFVAPTGLISINSLIWFYIRFSSQGRRHFAELRRGLERTATGRPAAARTRPPPLRAHSVHFPAREVSRIAQSRSILLTKPPLRPRSRRFCKRWYEANLEHCDVTDQIEEHVKGHGIMSGWTWSAAQAHYQGRWMDDDVENPYCVQVNAIRE